MRVPNRRLRTICTCTLQPVQAWEQWSAPLNRLTALWLHKISGCFAWRVLNARTALRCKRSKPLWYNQAKLRGVIVMHNECSTYTKFRCIFIQHSANLQSSPPSYYHATACSSTWDRCSTSLLGLLDGMGFLYACFIASSTEPPSRIGIVHEMPKTFLRKYPQVVHYKKPELHGTMFYTANLERILDSSPLWLELIHSHAPTHVSQTWCQHGHDHAVAAGGWLFVSCHCWSGIALLHREVEQYTCSDVRGKIELFPGLPTLWLKVIRSQIPIHINIDVNLVTISAATNS